MTSLLAPPTPGTDLTSAFRAAYENRYTWAPGFGGYQGRCLWEQQGRVVEGTFAVKVAPVSSSSRSRSVKVPPTSTPSL